MFQNSVTVGPKFFAKAFNDYSNKYWAFAREILQNSIDCGSTQVDITVALSDSDATHVHVENNGEPMTQDILVNKLLSLGESGKDFQDSVGGFGKAKEILYFAHREYKITTGSLHVHGSGAGYNLEAAVVPLPGTWSYVTWEGGHSDQLIAAFCRFIELCQTNVKFTLNGEAVHRKLDRGDFNRTLDNGDVPWANVLLSHGEQNLIVVRIGGMPMFTMPTTFKVCVCVDLVDSMKLTSNRDHLRYPFSNQLSDFVTSIAVDKRTVFKLEKAEYKRFVGKKLRRAKHDATTKAAAQFGWTPADCDAVRTAASVMGGGGIKVETLERRDEVALLLGHEFIVKNCVRKPVPKDYDPSSFGRYAAWLAKAWAGCLLEIHDILEIDAAFSVGFVFSEDFAAEFEASSEYGDVYYLNPCKVAKQSYTKRFSKADQFQVLAYAAHEVIHGAMGEQFHGEDFASKLTEVMAKVMANMRRFKTHLK